MSWRETLKCGTVIPAHPLALTAERKLDERRQRALSRYYSASGAKGIAVAVHTTQFEIHKPKCGLLQPVLELAIAEFQESNFVKIAGICGDTSQAVQEARLAADLGYHVGLVSLAELPQATVDELLVHIKAITEILPVMGFYLQPAVSGRPLPYEFWRSMADIEGVVAIKVAPFNRYRTLDVIRGVLDSNRAGEITLYTGNDDNIVGDLLTSFETGKRTAYFAGGLLGQWAVWTSNAVTLLNQIKRVRSENLPSLGLMTLGQQITDANSAIFDASNNFHGCIPGIHEVLRRQGLLAGRWCLNPDEELSTGQLEEIDRVLRTYPHLSDAAFVHEHLDEWLQ